MTVIKKHSKKREAILETICSTTTHPTAEWVYMRVKQKYPDISLGTVYRNISSFVDEGTIMQVTTVNGQSRYDGNVKPHNHFVCESCGSVIDIMTDFDTGSFDDEVRQIYDFDVSGHQLIFYGKCKKCKDTRNKPENQVG